MELRDLRTFAAVARLLSFYRAAAELNAAQSTVSARIAALETELGLRLFERLGRRVALTEAGERLVHYAAKLIDVEDEARAWVTGESRLRGQLTVRVPESLCAYRLPPVIAAFRRRHPEVALHLTACTLNGLEKDLRQGITDLAFVMADSVHGGDLNVEVLGMEPLALVAAPHHPLATRERVTARDLHGVTLALSTADCAYRTVIEEALAAEGVHPAAGLEFSSVAALRGCVALGVGVALLPMAAVRDDVRAGTLRALAWADHPFETGVLMVRHRGKWVSPYMDTFMELCRAACADATGAAGNPEPIWDFPCPMADVATVLEPPKPVPPDARPDATGQPVVADAVGSPGSLSGPDTPGVSGASGALGEPDEPVPPTTQGNSAETIPARMPNDTTPGELNAEPHDDTDAEVNDKPDDLLHDLPSPSSVPWAEPESGPGYDVGYDAGYDTGYDAAFMDDADTGPETVWGTPPDMTPDMVPDMTPEIEAEPEFVTSQDVPWDYPDDFDRPAQPDEPYPGGADGPDDSGTDTPDDTRDMPPYAPKPMSPPTGSAPDQAPPAISADADVAPENRQPSLWDMPQASGQPPVSAAPASASADADVPDAPTAPHAPTRSGQPGESRESREQGEPGELGELGELGEPSEPSTSGKSGVPPHEHTRLDTPEHAPEPAPEAQQWLSLLPPKR